MSGPIVAGGHFLVLVARVPAAGKRWMQVHFNMAVAQHFFQVMPGDTRLLALERVKSGSIIARSARPLVYSEANRNCKVELDFSPAGANDYPTDGRTPLAVLLELDLHTFRYVALMPDDVGYQPMLDVNTSSPARGRGHRRVVTTLDEIELRWPGVGLRSPEAP